MPYARRRRHKSQRQRNFTFNYTVQIKFPHGLFIWPYNIGEGSDHLAHQVHTSSLSMHNKPIPPAISLQTILSHIPHTPINSPDSPTTHQHTWCIDTNESTNQHMLGIWQENRTPWGKPCSHNENMQTPHKQLRRSRLNPGHWSMRVTWGSSLIFHHAIPIVYSTWLKKTLD